MGAINYNPTVSKKDKIDLHAAVRTEDTENMCKNCSEEVKIVAQYEQYRPDFLDELLNLE